MCGRYYNRRQKQQIAEQLRAGTVFDAPYEPNYNATRCKPTAAIRLSGNVRNNGPEMLNSA